jgi:hypothetical protein
LVVEDGDAGSPSGVEDRTHVPDDVLRGGVVGSAGRGERAVGVEVVLHVHDEDRGGRHAIAGEGAVTDGSRVAGQVRHPAAQLVVVQRPLGEEPQDRQLHHGVSLHISARL